MQGAILIFTYYSYSAREVAPLLPMSRESRSAEQLDELERLLQLCEVQAVRSGAPLPLGAHMRGNGVNFAIFSRHATGVRLDLFDRAEDTAPARSIILDAARNKTGDIWHVWLEGIRPGQLYGFRIAGPYAPHEGHRFNPNKLVLDPCATAIVPPADRDSRFAAGYDPSSPQKDLSFSDVDNAGSAPKCVITYEDFDWHGDQPLRLPWTSTVIYELHVRGYTIDPSAGVQTPGTYRGLIQKIPYLKDLGVTAVELMPVQEFNEHDSLRINPRTGERLKNFWGYDPVSFFAPKASYASVRDDGAQVLEFKEMVRAFHREGLEVILDVVFNHTGEGDELGPTLSFRGIDNAIYYWLADDKRFYRNFTGTGQTVNASHPVVRDLILDALRYWVMEMHVDGFRFDLASVLGRDVRGHVLADAPLLERIAEDPILRDAKLIAEAWDVAGAYQVGCFSQRRWAEWNGHFRDDVRRFWRGDAGMMGRFASRICGSSDLYAGSGKGPECSVNFVTCHDGFTLNDLVSYSRKHNEANGEGNRDGADENFSANYGVEGESDGPSRRSRSPAADQELPADPRNLPWRADAPRRETSSGELSVATTTRIVRTTRPAGSTGRLASGTPNSFVSLAASSHFAGRTRSCVGKRSTPTGTFSGLIPTGAARTGSTPTRSAWRVWFTARTGQISI